MKKPNVNISLYPLVWLAAFFSLGILFSHFFDLAFGILLTACAAFVVLTIIFLRERFAAILLCAAFFLLGGICSVSEKQNVRDDRIKLLYDNGEIESGEPVEIEGSLTGQPEPAFDGYFLTIRVEALTYNAASLPVSGNVKFFAPTMDKSVAAEYEALDLHYGSRIRVACNIEREDRFLNPGVVPARTILDQQVIDATGTIKSPLLIEKTGEDAVFVPLAWIHEQRQNLIYLFRRNFSNPTAGVLIASLLGDRYFLDKQTADIFREGGTFHVLVISGLHITFIGGLMLLFLRFFTRRRLWQFLIASLFLWSYTLAVGAEVPVVRATGMFTVLAFSQVINRKGTLLNALGLCGLLLLVWRPGDLFTTSFQLTFVSVAAIVVMAFPLIEILRRIGTWMPTAREPFPANVPGWLIRFCEALYWREKVWEIEGTRQVWSAKLFKSPGQNWLAAWNLRSIVAYIFEGLLVSLIVQMWLLPFVVIYFHRISFASAVLNLWVGLFIALESFVAVGAVVLGNVSGMLALPLIKLTELFNWILVEVPRFFGDGGWASFRLPAYAGSMKAVYFLYFMPVLALAYAAFHWQPFSYPNSMNAKLLGILRASIIMVLIFGSTIVFHPFSSPTPDGRLHVDFLDVGQGDSALVTFPDGETMLVDGGGRRSYRTDPGGEDSEEPQFQPDTQRIGEAVVSQVLWEKGYSKIDYILATHADADHIQGLTDVAKNFRIGHALFGRTPINDPDFAELYEVLQKKGIAYTTISKGDQLTVGGVTVDILYPEADDSPMAVSDNNHSVVLRLMFGDRKILLTGDIERTAENVLLNSPEYVSADIVKVPHHGSRTSSTQHFIDAAHPLLAVISVGRRSMFGHPHPEVVERWKASGANIMTTGERGMISVSTEGKDLVTNHFLPKN